MRSTGAEVIKIAARANRLSDVLPLLDLATRQPASSNRSAPQQTVLIGMGPAGLITRVLPAKFGSAWTYAGNVSDVGQVTAATLIDLYRFRTLSESTALYGLTGSPIAHSVSPDMHNRAFAALGMDAVYLPLPAHDADDFLRFARAVGLRGASVTLPFKVPLYERVDERDDVSVRVGALNTVKRTANGWAGTNTDVEGFLQPLRTKGVAFGGLRAAILGAGGSARGAAIALRAQGAAVTIHARDLGKATATATAVGAAAAEFPPKPGSWDLLVNCTPVGMHPSVDATPIDAGLLTGPLVYDLIYNPITTRLLREARHVGCDTIGGLDMLVAQAVEQFTWWTGLRPSAEIMRAAALARLPEFTIDEAHLV
jgi:3-dehydroquinate dehydratase/shikimate dehydrogenase